jgi:succinoglycan biosynthesis transport protein ExoP
MSSQESPSVCRPDERMAAGAEPLPAIAPAPPARTGIARLVRALRRRWLLALGLGLLGGLVAGLALWRTLPTGHTAEVTLHLQRSANAGEPASDQQTQAALLHSPVVLQAVLRRPEVAELPTVDNQPDPLAWLEQKVQVESQPGRSTLRLRVQAEDAGLAVLLANTIAAEYVREAEARRHASLNQLHESYRRAEEVLRLRRQRLEQLDDPRLQVAEKELQQARFDLSMARAETGVLEARRKSIARIVAPDSSVQEAIERDPASREVFKALEQLEDHIKRELRISAEGERGSSVVELRREQAALEKKLQRRREELRPGVEKQFRAQVLADAETRLEALRKHTAILEEAEKTLAAEVKRLGGAPEAGEARAVRAEVAEREEALRRLGAEVRVAEGQDGPPPVTWAGPGATKVIHDWEGRLRLAGLGGLAVFALLGLVVSCHEARAGRVLCAADLVQELGLPVVGSMPAVPGRLLRPATPQAPRDSRQQARLTEAVDGLRTLLLRNSDGPRLVMVTSAVDGEGKTSLAAQLAVSLARAWRKTVLIDGDLRNPAAHAAFDVPLEPGLSELLRGEAEPADIVRPTAAGRLWLVPAGQWDAHAVQALAQEGTAEVFEQFIDQYDFVVLDAGPVLPVADAQVLSQYADIVLLAVRAGVSRLAAVQAARERLAALEAPVLGAVIVAAR